MQFLIITGMSGAGKSYATTILEDLGYYCIDNLPLELIPKLVEICSAAKEQYEKVALVIDVRVGSNFKMLKKALSEITNIDAEYQVMFLDADTNVLVNRYKETRRKHPLVSKEVATTREAVELERSMLEDVKANADFVINTTTLRTSGLRDTIINMLSADKQNTLIVNVNSFGFKYGALGEADLLFDVRFLPNPFYVKELRECTGLQMEVQDYVMKNQNAQDFLDKVCDLVDFLLPQYIEEGKATLTIGIGCTGGKHRSVTLAERIFSHIEDKNYNVMISHRDIKR